MLLFKSANGLKVAKVQKFAFGALLNLSLRQGSRVIAEVLQQFCQCWQDPVALGMELVLWLCPASLLMKEGWGMGAELQLLKGRWSCQTWQEGQKKAKNRPVILQTWLYNYFQLLIFIWSCQKVKPHLRASAEPDLHLPVIVLQMKRKKDSKIITDVVWSCFCHSFSHKSPVIFPLWQGLWWKIEGLFSS